jgi:hypothetical protein
LFQADQRVQTAGAKSFQVESDKAKTQFLETLYQFRAQRRFSEARQFGEWYLNPGEFSFMEPNTKFAQAKGF